MASLPDSAASSADTSRRRDLRLQIVGQLYGHVVALDVPLAVQNLSAGGFAVETPVPFHAGSSHQFRFTIENGKSITVDALAVHCMRCRTPTGHARYLAGFEFVSKPDDPAAKAAIDTLLDSALSVLSFDA